LNSNNSELELTSAISGCSRTAGHRDAAERWRSAMASSQQVYEVHPRKDKRGLDLISDVLPFGVFTRITSHFNISKFKAISLTSA
jgi:hypothetical protein